MKTGDNSFRLFAQAMAFLCLIMAVICCLCGAITSVSSLVPLEGSTTPVLPDGTPIDPALIPELSLVNLLMFFVFSAVVLAVGLGIWYLFGRRQRPQNLVAAIVAVGAFIGSLSFCLWSILVGAMGLLTDGFLPTSQTVGAEFAVISAITCLVPAGILALVGGTVWYQFLSNRTSPKPTRSPMTAMSLEGYLDYLLQLKGRSKNDFSWELAQLRTQTILNEVTKGEQAKVIQALYDGGFIQGEDPPITLIAVDLSDIDLAHKTWNRINLAGANLQRANMANTFLHGANLRRAKLQQAILVKADLSGASLAGADLREAKCHHIILAGAEFFGADLKQANLYRANLHGAQVTEAQLEAAKSVEGVIRLALN